MIQDTVRRKPGEGFWLWLIKILTGIGIIALLIIHFIVNHFVAEGALLTHADVVAYYRNPWVVLMEGVFLVLVVSHSLIGMRSILLDLQPPSGVVRTVDWLFAAIGIVSVVYGLWLIQAIVAMGAGA